MRTRSALRGTAVGRVYPVLVLSLATALAALPSSGCAEDNAVRTPSEGPHLFLDDCDVARMENVRRVLKQPVKHPDNPLIVREYPWEKRILEIYGTVLYEAAQAKYRCWYLANEFKDGIPDNPEHPQTVEYYTCYAESDDGLRWTRPMVGEGAFGSHAKHNIVIPDTHGFCVLPTPDDPDPDRRYKGAGGAAFGFSPDGLKWDVRDWHPAVGKNDTSTCVVRWRGEYLAYVRFQAHDPDWPGVMRAVGLTSSKDFDHWSPKKPILITDEADGYPWVQPYGISVTPYGDVLIGILWVLHLDRREGNNTVGTMDTQLVVSRDGRHWTRVADRAVFLEPTPDTWDRGRVFPGTTMLVKDDTIRIYYTGVTTRHGEGWGPMGIGMATLPADRFVGLERIDASRAGVLETRPAVLHGRDLLVNAETAVDGIRVELVSGAGDVIPGFDRDRCRLLSHDALRFRVVWEDEQGVHSLKDAPDAEPLAIRFILLNGTLYAFETPQ